MTKIIIYTSHSVFICVTHALTGIARKFNFVKNEICPAVIPRLVARILTFPVLHL